ncbi:uncharacterized protein LOC143920700 [Arctopsyche grandis]|uniref:uncharacterized protein LOC143920700 n=1 Tax=Arctopsyche grandis TaxID=121162 RepID=UPI00406D98BC
MMSNTDNRNGVNKLSVNVDISSVLTAKTCAAIVVEVIKFIAFQKFQIPYNFEHLKYVVEKKRAKNKDFTDVNESWQSQHYFRTTSAALDALETLIKNIHCEFEKEVVPNEVCIILGSNTLCAKELYRIVIPHSMNDHFHENHTKDSQNLIRTVLRHLVCSEDLQNFIYRPLLPTNMHILIKRKFDMTCDFLTSEFFLPINSLGISPKTPEAVINLEYSSTTSSINCCRLLKIFNDSISKSPPTDNEMNKQMNSATILNDSNFDDKDWFQANVCVKGFKACFVNGESVSDLWTR